jgi:hypothetical protein
VNDEPDPNAELRLHAGWWARLEGDKLDLETLAGAFGSESSAQVRWFDGHYYMRMSEFDSLEQSDAVETRAGEVLRVVNGAARVEYGNSREVRVDAVARVQPTGEIQHFVHMSAAIHARSRISVTASVSGATDAEPRPTLTQRAVEVALCDTEAERALRIFGRDDADHRDLYHVLEIAQAAWGMRSSRTAWSQSPRWSGSSARPTRSTLWVIRRDTGGSEQIRRRSRCRFPRRGRS